MKQYKHIKIGSYCVDAGSQESIIDAIEKQDDSIVRYYVRGKWLTYKELIWKYCVLSNGQWY